MAGITRHTTRWKSPPLPNQLEDTFQWTDALVAAHTSDSKYVITSPNMTFVPEAFVGLIQVFLCKDGRYGPYDPTQWPQIHTPGFEYLCCVRRRMTDEPLYFPVWRTPDKLLDFDPIQGCSFRNLGLISRSWVRDLNNLVDALLQESEEFIRSVDRTAEEHLRTLMLSMRQARYRLLHFPSTFRDMLLQLRATQRFWLLTRAYLDYVCQTSSEPHPALPTVSHHFMGAFTTDPHVVETLSSARIPVWHIRPDGSILEDTKISSVVLPTKPNDIVTEPWCSNGTPLFSGLVGAEHLRVVFRRAMMYTDFSRAPLLVRYHCETYNCKSSQDTSGTGPTRQPKMHRRRDNARRTHPSHTRGRDKALDIEHSWMPRAIPVWKDALQSLDRARPAARGAALWGYWIPEPALLLGPQKIDRTVRYLRNWLRVRPAWLYLLSQPDTPATRVDPQWWRDFLNGDLQDGNAQADSRRSKRLERVREVFGLVFDMQDYVEDLGAPIRWFDRQVRENLDDIARLVIWEVFELGFRYELLSLDRILVPSCTETMREDLLARVFPHEDLVCLHTLPTYSRGLGADLFEARIPYLESFRQVLIRWPLCPNQIRSSMPLALATPRHAGKDMEAAMIKFYTQTFLDYSGRVPITPHAFPAQS